MVGKIGNKPIPRGCIELHVWWFGDILELEQTDVCRVLLADSPYAPAPGA